jgi:hypothetical protein
MSEPYEEDEPEEDICEFCGEHVDECVCDAEDADTE